MDEKNKMELASYVAADGRDEILTLLEVVPNKRIQDLILYLKTSTWRPTIERVSYDGKVLNVKIGYNIALF